MLAQGDSGLQLLYSRHWAELCSYVRRQFGAGPPDPEDIAQEAFIKFAAIRHSQEITNARAYLYRAAHNISIDEQRRIASHSGSNRAGKDDFDASDDRTPERVLAGRERLDTLTQALLAMPEARRRSFLLHRLQGLSCAAIARMTGYSDSAVKKHIALAMSDLEAAVTVAEQVREGDPT